MIIGHHLMWTAYGCWLPNDPRGSMSRHVAIELISGLGEHHYGRKQDQPRSHQLRQFYDQAKHILTHELLTFEPEDIAILACSFARTIKTEKYTCYACALMPDHVHMLIRKHRDRAEDMIAKLQAASRKALRDAKRRSLEHPVWGGPGWKVFQNTSRHMRTTIEYIRQNPVKISRPIQEWDFVTPYDGWVPGGHPERRR